MIIANGKPFDEVYGIARKHRKVLVLGCGSCVTVCMAGGEKEAEILAAQIQLAAREKNDQITVEQHTIVRQCDKEFFDEETRRKFRDADVIISLACGVGVQCCNEWLPDSVTYPGVNTSFYGANIEQGVWSERCAGCGTCIIGSFGGVCPIARCSKTLLNGPCGGSDQGKCEVDPDHIDCAWQLIHDRMEKLGRLSELETIQPARDWSTGRDGGPRTRTREDMRL